MCAISWIAYGRRLYDNDCRNKEADFGNTQILRIPVMASENHQKGSGYRYLNHLYTNKKWNVRQERIQEILYWSHGASRYQDDLYASTAERIKRQSLLTPRIWENPPKF